MNGQRSTINFLTASRKKTDQQISGQQSANNQIIICFFEIWMKNEGLSAKLYADTASRQDKVIRQKQSER